MKFHELIERFVDHYGFDTIVAIVSNNSFLGSTIRSAQRKEVSVLLIYGHNCSEELITSANHCIGFDDIFGFNRIVTLSITNIPIDKSRKTIRDSFAPICRQLNCKFRYNRRDLIKLDFNNANDAKRAELSLSEVDFFGHRLGVTVDGEDDNIQETLRPIDSSPISEDSIASIASPVRPQNDDKCKSVIIGLYTKSTENLIQLVRKIINSWNESTLNESIVLRVNRERDFFEKDGKASLIVTVIDPQTNDRLLTVAKNRFVDRENKLYWNRLRRSKKELMDSSIDSETNANGLNALDFPNDCKSIVIGLWTQRDDNVLELIRKLVKSWNSSDLNVNHIICVERAKKFNEKDGKAALIVCTDSAETNHKLLRSASHKFIDNKHKLYWKPMKPKQAIDSLELMSKPINESIDKCLGKTTEKSDRTSRSYASIASKPIGRQNNVSSAQNQNSITKSYSSGGFSHPIPRRRSENNCNCQ